MEILKFKTNIKCGGCIETVTPFLNQESSIHQWKVDTNTPEKVLTVSGQEVDPQKVKNIVEKAGFKADLLQVLGANGGDI